MKKILIVLLLTSSYIASFAQGDIIRTNPVSPTVGAANYNKQRVVDNNLKIALTLNIPTGTAFTHNNSNPAVGNIFYNTSTQQFAVWNGTTWQVIGGSSAAATWGSILGTLADQTDLMNALNAKQATLVSGSNIKTVNGSSLLGSGNLTIAGGVTSVFGRTGDVVAQAGDYSSFYPSLSGSYANPSWITSLAYSKITGVPAFITTETDPTVPVYSKSLTNFNVIKSSTDALYYPIGNPNGYISSYTETDPLFNTKFLGKTTTDLAEGTNLYFNQGRVSANTDVSANTAARHSAVTLGTPNGLSLSGQQLSLGLASSGSTGALSGTDWNTFSSKQNQLILTTSGTSGTASLIGNTLNIPNYATGGGAGSSALRVPVTLASNATVIPITWSTYSATYGVSPTDLSLIELSATGDRQVFTNWYSDDNGVTYKFDVAPETGSRNFVVVISGGSTVTSGNVTSVTSANGDISVTNSNTTPVLTLNSGTGANQIVKRNGSGLISDLAPYLLSSTAATTYYPLASNPAGYLTEIDTVNTYIKNQNTSPQNGNYNITGTAVVGNDIKLGTAFTGYNFPFEIHSPFNFAGWSAAFLSQNYGADATYGGLLLGYRQNTAVIGEIGTKNIALAPDGGNILIGSTTDNGIDKLQILGSAKISGDLGTIGSFNNGLRINNTNSSGYSELKFDGDNVFSGNQGSLVLGYGGSGLGNIAYLFQRRNASLSFGTNNIERLTIQATGETKINNLSGTGDRPIFAGSDGTLKIGSTTSGTVTNVSSANSNISVANGSTAPVLTLNSTITSNTTGNAASATAPQNATSFKTSLGTTLQDVLSVNNNAATNIKLVNGTQLSLVTNSDDYGIGTPNIAGLQIFTATGDVIRFGHMTSNTFTERARFTPGGNYVIGSTADNGEKFQVTGKATVSAAPSNPTDVVRKTELDTKQNQINGTGFVKATGTTISFDNTSYYPTSNPNGYTSNTGTVTNVSSANANISVATGGTTPVLTLNSTITSNTSGNASTSTAPQNSTSFKTALATTLQDVTAVGNTSTNVIFVTGNNAGTVPTSGNALNFQQVPGGISLIESYNHTSNTGNTLSINPAGGRVLISTGTDNGSGAKLQVNGKATVSLAPTNPTDVVRLQDLPTPYTLPTASSTVLGGVKVGSGLSIDGGGVLSSTTPVLPVYPTSASAYSMTDGGIYRFTGSTSTFTLPPVAGNVGKFLFIANRGSGTITLNTNTGANELYSAGTLSNTALIAAGATSKIINDGVNWSFY